jgi:hypothetical protein
MTIALLRDKRCSTFELLRRSRKHQFLWVVEAIIRTKARSFCFLAMEHGGVDNERGDSATDRRLKHSSEKAGITGAPARELSPLEQAALRRRLRTGREAQRRASHQQLSIMAALPEMPRPTWSKLMMTTRQKFKS